MKIGNRIKIKVFNLVKETSELNEINFRNCCSHAFWETNSLRRTMQIVSAVSYTSWPKAESLLSQGPQPVFVNTLYTLSVPAQTHLPKFPETSLNS